MRALLPDAALVVEVSRGVAEGVAVKDLLHALIALQGGVLPQPQPASRRIVDRYACGPHCGTKYSIFVGKSPQHSVKTSDEPYHCHERLFERMQDMGKVENARIVLK
jgi:hypothetical protein